MACSGRPGGDPVTNTVHGTVFVSGPVSGAVVVAYELDAESGEKLDKLAESEPTGPDGRFTLDLGPTVGLVLFEAAGPAASWTEPASGSNATFDGPTTLRALAAERDPVSDRVSVGLELGTSATVAIGPISELAVAYALALTDDNERPANESLELSFELFRAHVEYDFWRVAPSTMTDDALGAFDENAQAALLHLGLSHFARRIANENHASPGSLSSLTLLEALRADLIAGPVFDGQAGGGTPKRIGACVEEQLCLLSPRSARGDWAESLVLFLAEPTNTTGFTYPDVRRLVDRMSHRESALFYGAGGPADTTPPKVTVTGLDPRGDLWRENVPSHRRRRIRPRRGRRAAFSATRQTVYPRDGLRHPRKANRFECKAIRHHVEV